MHSSHEVNASAYNFLEGCWRARLGDPKTNWTLLTSGGEEMFLGACVLLFIQLQKIASSAYSRFRRWPILYSHAGVECSMCMMLLSFFSVYAAVTQPHRMLECADQTRMQTRCFNHCADYFDSQDTAILPFVGLTRKEVTNGASTLSAFVEYSE